MRKLYANVNLLLKEFSKCSVDVKCFLFKTYCSNLCCAPMWFDCTKAALKKLKIAYNISLRRFMFLSWRNSATEMFVNIGIHSFNEMLRIFIFSVRFLVTASHNQLICSLCSAHRSVFFQNCEHGGIAYYIIYIINAIIYLMHLLYANLYFIPFVYILFNAL